MRWPSLPCSSWLVSTRSPLCRHRAPGPDPDANPHWGDITSQYALGLGQWLQALAYTLSKPREIAIVGEPEGTDTQALLNVVRSGYRPFQVVAVGGPDAQGPTAPLLKDRGLVNGQAAAYVCRDFACQAPVTEPEELQVQLEPRQSWLM